jgi:pSer/pThr/pTyr-binding forkhead associated (FHA) protein
VNDNGWMLREPSGQLHRLNSQQIMVGRGRDNEIRLDSEFRNISRRHLLLEPLDDHVIILTDLSSHGTFAPAIQTEHVAV